MPSTRSSGHALEAGSLDQRPSQWAVVPAGDEDDALVVADVEPVTTGAAFADAIDSAARTAQLIASGNAGPQHLLHFVKTMAAFAPAIASQDFVDDHLAAKQEQLMTVVHAAVARTEQATAGFVGESQREFALQFQTECQNFGALICAEVDRRLQRSSDASAEWQVTYRDQLAEAMQYIAQLNNESTNALQALRDDTSRANAQTAEQLSELLVARTTSLSQVFHGAIAEVRSSMTNHVDLRMAAQQANLDGSLEQMKALVQQNMSDADIRADTAALRRASDVFVRLTQSSQATFEASQAHTQALVETSQAATRNETSALVLGVRGEMAQTVASQNASTMQRMAENVRAMTNLFDERMRVNTQELQAAQRAETTIAAAKADVARQADRHETRAFVTDTGARMFSQSVKTSAEALNQTADAQQSALDTLTDQLQQAESQNVLTRSEVGSAGV